MFKAVVQEYKWRNMHDNVEVGKHAMMWSKPASFASISSILKQLPTGPKS